MKIKRLYEAKLDWKIRKAEPYFTISMKKLNCPDIKFLKHMINITPNNDEFVIIMKGLFYSIFIP